MPSTPDIAIMPRPSSDPAGRRPLTIGLPVYNGQRFLSKALDSILEQTFADFTLVVSDNASTDATVEIVQEYASRDQRVVLLRNTTNKGAAWNYNRVFEQCQSPYFKWAAADDLLAPTCLARLLDELQASPPTVAAVYPLAQIIDAEGRLIRTCDDNLAAPPGSPPHLRLRQVLQNLYLGNVVFALVRADALRRTRLHGNYPSADYVLLAELALAGEFRCVREPLFLRRLHDTTSVSANPAPAARTVWFDTARKPVHHYSWNLFHEYLGGIHHADLPTIDKPRVYATFFRTVFKPWTRLRRLAHRVVAPHGHDT